MGGHGNGAREVGGWGGGWVGRWVGGELGGKAGGEVVMFGVILGFTVCTISRGDEH